MLVYFVTDEPTKLPAIRAMLEPQHAVVPWVLGGDGTGIRSHGVLMVDIDLRQMARVDQLRFILDQLAGIPEKLFAVPGGDAVQPVLVRPHEAPKRHPSALGNREGANLLCLNVYTSKSRIPPGSVTAGTMGDTGAGSAAIATELNAVGICTRSQSCWRHRNNWLV